MSGDTAVTLDLGFRTLSPVLISHLLRCHMAIWACLCIMITLLRVCSGLGYITGRGFASLTGDWHWALRVRTFFLFTMQKCDLIQSDAGLFGSVLRSHPSWAQWDSFWWSFCAPTRREVLQKPTERVWLSRALTWRMSNIFWRSTIYILPLQAWKTPNKWCLLLNNLVFLVLWPQ